MHKTTAPSNKIFFYYKYLQGIQDYIFYKTHRILYYDEKGSNKEPSGIRLWKQLRATRALVVTR
jgi:hypothetical protein